MANVGGITLDLWARGDGLLLGAQPNPFNPALTVWFTASIDDRATIEAFYMKGRRLRALWAGELMAGERRALIPLAS